MIDINFRKILELNNIDTDKCVPDGKGNLICGSMYGLGKWYYSEKEEVAYQTCCRERDDEQEIFHRQFKLNDGKLVKISEEIL